jgi:putative lipoprotein
MIRTASTGMLVLSLAIVGCSGHGNDKRVSEPAGSAKAPSAVPNPEPVEPVVKGTVSYRERMALPDDAEVALWIMDVTPGIIVAQVVLAETTVKTLGKQVPVEFELPYDAARVVGDHDYGLRAVITSGGGELFATPEPVPVITKGKSNQVELVLRRSAP